MNSFPVGYRIPKKKLEAIPKKKSETAVMKLVNIINFFCMWASIPTSNSSGNNQIFSLALDEGFCVGKTTCINYDFKFQRLSIGNNHLSHIVIRKDEKILNFYRVK